MQHDQAPPTSIAVIGGGIGGLTAAACLLRAGFDVHVYEQASRLSEVGAGINIGPNASRILHRLGIAEELKKSGIKPVSFDQRRWDDGRLLLRSPLGEEVEAAFGAPYYTLHRGDLHRALVNVIPADCALQGFLSPPRSRGAENQLLLCRFLQRIFYRFEGLELDSRGGLAIQPLDFADI